MQAEALYDVTIIGGGPAGLYAAFYSGLREMKTKIIECQPQLGGKVHVYPEKMIWDVGGLTPLPGAKLIEQMVEQGLTFDPEVVLGEKVTSISRADDGTLTLHAASGREHYSRTVILAIGGGILKPTKLDIEGAERFEVANLHYTVKSLAYFKGKTVLISGGGNSAVDWANELSQVAKYVILTYRNDALKGHEAEVTRLMNGSVDCRLNTKIGRLIASDNREAIAQVELIDVADGSSTLLAVDEVIINHGYERDKELLDNSEVKIAMKNEYCIEGGPLGQTSEPGVFAAGDILHHDGKLHLIAGAFQDAANAVNQAKLYIAPEANAWGMVSSHNELFKQRNRELIQELVRTD